MIKIGGPPYFLLQLFSKKAVGICCIINNMSLYFITGSAGAGKTTIQKELSSRGYAAYDTDDPEKTGLSALHERSSGKAIAQYNEFNWGQDGISFDTHIWGLTVEGLSRVVDESEKRHVFLVGRLREPMSDLDDALSLRFFLTLPEAVIAERLRRRAELAENGQDVVLWGMDQSQIDFTVEQNPKLTNQYRLLGAVMIDARPEPSIVADEIEKHL